MCATFVETGENA